MSGKLPGIISFCVGLLVTVSIVSCGDNKNITEHPVLQAAEQGTAPEQLQSLALPISLKGFIEAPRETSYTEDDLFRYGKFFEPLLPNTNVDVIGDGAEFTTSWAPGDGAESLAYCMFSFPAVDFDRASELYFGYTVEPENYGDVWIGLANWTDNKWDWFAADASGRLDFSTTMDFLNGDETLVAVFVLTGSSGSILRWVQLGPPQVDAQIFSFTQSGIAPLSVELDSSGSTTVFGLITNYEWDWEGDGTFDETTVVATTSHSYDTVGEYNPTVRVSTNLGTSGTATRALSVFSTWEHTWGGLDFDDTSCIAVDNDGAVYCGGRTISFSQGEDDALLLKYNMVGELQWARAWGGADDEAITGIALGDDGSVYVTGYTQTWGEGNSDVLLQQWSTDGEIIWSSTWGSTTNEMAHALARRGDAIFIAGESNINAGITEPNDALIAKFDLLGNCIWASTFGGISRDDLKDVAVVKPLLGQIEIRVAGTLNMDNSSSQMLYAHFNDDGTAEEIRVWDGNLGMQTYGTSIQVMQYPAPMRVWVGGYEESWSGGHHGLMPRFDTPPDTPALFYGMDDGQNTYSYALHGGWDDLVLGGSVPGIGSNDRAFMLHIYETGEIISSKAFGADSGESCSLSALAQFAENGVVGVGTGSSAADSNWTDFEFDYISSYESAWSDTGISAVSASGTKGTPEGTLTYVTTATLDTGGGDNDALVVVMQTP